MLVLSLWFSALLAGLDGLILAAFAQMKRSVIFVVVEILEITAVALGAARAILFGIFVPDIDIVDIPVAVTCAPALWACVSVCQVYYCRNQHPRQPAGERVHIPHSASARARRQGPVLLLNALESAKT